PRPQDDGHPPPLGPGRGPPAGRRVPAAVPERFLRQPRASDTLAAVKRALLVLLLLAASPAAAASRVVLLRSGSAEALPRQAETLLAAELRASGFEVLARERTAGLELRADIEAAAAALRPIAVLAIASSDGAAAEIWLSDRVTGKLVI